MPRLNILNWNSRGETASGVSRLREVIAGLLLEKWIPHVIVIQEARAQPRGPLYQLLARLGPEYNPPVHARTGGEGAKGYLLATHHEATGDHTFARANLAEDPGLQQWLTSLGLTPRERHQAEEELARLRMPASATLGFQGRSVAFLTWHVPRGPGSLLGSELEGGANPDAFLFLKHSSLYERLKNPGLGNLGVVAGDLNATQSALEKKNIPGLGEPLEGFKGFSYHLDHVLAHAPDGQGLLSTGRPYEATGDHSILAADLSW